EGESSNGTRRRRRGRGRRGRGYGGGVGPIPTPGSIEEGAELEEEDDSDEGEGEETPVSANYSSGEQPTPPATAETQHPAEPERSSFSFLSWLRRDPPAPVRTEEAAPQPAS